MLKAWTFKSQNQHWTKQADWSRIKKNLRSKRSTLLSTFIRKYLHHYGNRRRIMTTPEVVSHGHAFSFCPVPNTTDGYQKRCPWIQYKKQSNHRNLVERKLARKSKHITLFPEVDQNTIRKSSLKASLIHSAMFLTFHDHWSTYDQRCQIDILQRLCKQKTVWILLYKQSSSNMSIANLGGLDLRNDPHHLSSHVFTCKLFKPPNLQ